MKKLYFKIFSLLAFLGTALNGYAADGPVYSSIDPTHVYKIINRATGQALEIGGGDDLTADRHATDLWGYWGGAHQQWRFVYATSYNTYTPSIGAHYILINVNANKTLLHNWFPGNNDPDGINQQNTGNPNPLLNPQGSSALWDMNLVSTSDGLRGTITAVSAPNGKIYLGRNASNQVSLSTDSNQQWDIIDVNANPDEYEIVNAWSGQILRANQYDFGVSQSGAYYTPSLYHWTFSGYDASGNLSINNRYDGQALQIDGDATANGSTTSIRGFNSGANQKWALQDIGDSHLLTLAEATDGRQFKIYNRNSGKVLQVEGNTTDVFQEGRAINQWEYWNHPWQQWFVRRVNKITGYQVAPSVGNPSFPGSPTYSYLDPTHVYKIVNRRTGQALEIGGGGDVTAAGRTANLWGYWGGAHQQWYIKRVESGRGAAGLTYAYTIVNRNSAKSLNSDGFTSGATVGQLATSSNTGNTELWELNLVATSTGLAGTISSSATVIGNYFYPNLYPTGRYLTAAEENSGGTTGAIIRSADAKQIWDIIDVSTNPGVYLLVNYWNNQTIGANPNDFGVALGYNDNLANTQWNFAALSNGNVNIINRRAQQYLEINGNSIYNGSNSNVNDAGGASQEWRLTDINTGQLLTIAQATDGRAFRIDNANSGKALQVKGVNADGSTSSDYHSYNQPIDQWQYEGHPWQQWTVRFIGANRTAASLATNSATNALLSLYPNPARSELTLSLPGGVKPTYINVTDVRGAKVSVPYQSNGKVNVAGLAPGMYLLNASDGQTEYHQKFIKE